MKVTCPGCSKAFVAKDEFAGRVAVCPACKMRFSLPPLPPPVQDFSDVPDPVPKFNFLDEIDANSGTQHVAVRALRSLRGWRIPRRMRNMPLLKKLMVLATVAWLIGMPTIGTALYLRGFLPVWGLKQNTDWFFASSWESIPDEHKAYLIPMGEHGFSRLNKAAWDGAVWSSVIWFGIVIPTLIYMVTITSLFVFWFATNNKDKGSLS